jgi:hypothetical protein
VHTGRRWYLAARDVSRNSWRTFRVDRIEPKLSPAPGSPHASLLTAISLPTSRGTYPTHPTSTVPA